MKKINAALFYFVAILLLLSCEKTHINIESLSASVESITANSATINVTHNSKSSNLISRGVCWNTTSSAVLETPAKNYVVSTKSESNFSIDLDNLNASTTYFFRPFAIYENDTIYGEEIEFITDDYISFNPNITYGSTTDIDGNIYKTVQIGDQVWMAENLKVTHYRNGDPIMTHATREDLQSPVLYWYNNDEENKKVYGTYYNWMAVADKRNIAPEGWRIATKSDWETLFKHIENSPGALMEETSAHWNFGNFPFNTYNTNSTGFTAISTGVANDPIYEGRNGSWVIFWTPQSFNISEPYLTFLTVGQMSISFASDKVFNGYPVRCIKE